MHLLDFVEGGDHQDDGYAGAEYQGEGGDENGDQGQGEEERYGQDEDVDVQERRRRRRPQKDRRPYTITMAIRKTNWFESSMEWEDDHFRTEYRMSKDTFWSIVGILNRNPIFQSTGRKNQRPVHYQLGVFLLRYGVTGSRVRQPMLLASIGEGTVTLYCRRVIRALREYGLRCVAWPTEERKEEIKRGFKKICGLDGIVGAMDGTLVGLETKPRISGDSYISRKKTLSVNVQAWVDHTGQFTAFQTGWPGSRPDLALWPHTWVYQEREHLFAEGEYLLADGGYGISPIVLTPFARNELGEGSEGQRRREFNRKVSRARIVVEWAFGRLKARFPALRRLGAVRDIKDIYRAIQATMVLHNMCYQLGDSPDGFDAQVDEEVNDDDDDLGEDGEQVHEVDPDLTHLEAGRALRLQYLDTICPP